MNDYNNDLSADYFADGFFGHPDENIIRWIESYHPDFEDWVLDNCQALDLDKVLEVNDLWAAVKEEWPDGICGFMDFILCSGYKDFVYEAYYAADDETKEDMHYKLAGLQ